MEIEMYYASYPGTSVPMAFDSVESRDRYVAKILETDASVRAMTACEAFRATPSRPDGSRNFWNRDRSEIVNEP
jgi:hypothetical protein